MKTKADLMNPFPGLRSFRSDEDYLFFGREEQTLELVTRLQRNRFIAVVGTSGRGKSSLVRCGLLSRLQGGGMVEAGAHWEIAVMHPGGDPLRHLAAALLEVDLYDREAEDALPHLLATLGRSQFGLIEAVRQAKLPAGTNFLLVVDQFEEIFRYDEAGAAESERANDFIAMLREASAQTEVPIYIVTTMRSDFIGDCSRFEGLAETVNRGEYLIPGLNRDQFKAAIEGPIRVAGGQLAPRLLQRLLNDLGEEQDQLPCLQHALMRTWRVWQDRAEAPALDLEDYAQVGKMSQALSIHADEVFSGLATDRQRELCAAMFKALTVEGSEKRGIRRPRRLLTLCGTLGVAPAELMPIIDAFRHPEVSFLMPPSVVPLRDTTVIDLSHESLMRVWTRLRDWVDDEAKSVGIFRRLSESAALWRQGRTALCRDPELSIARTWLQTNRPNPVWAEQYGGHFDEAMAYLQSSNEVVEAEIREREARARAEASRKTRRQQWLIAGLAITIVGLLIGAIFGVRAQRNSAAQASQTDLVLGSRWLDDGKLVEGLAYLVRAGRRDRENPLVAPRLLAAMAARRFLLPTDPPLNLASPARSGAFSADGRWVVLEGEDGVVRRIDASTWQLAREYDFGQKVRPGGVSAAVKNREVMAVALADESILVCDFLTGQPRFPAIRPPAKIRQRGDNLTDFALSPDGRWLAVTGPAEVWVWDTANGELIATLPSNGYFRYFAFSPDSRKLAVARDKKIFLWSIPDRAYVGAPVESAVDVVFPNFSADGSRLLVMNYDGALIADATTGALIRPLLPLGVRSGTDFLLSNDGTKLINSTGGGTVVVLDVATGRPVYPPLLHGGNVRGVSLVDEGKIIFTNCVDGSVRFWDLATGALLAEPTLRQPRYAPTAAAPDGKSVVLFTETGPIYRFRVGGRPAAPLELPREKATTLFTNIAPELPARLRWLTHTESKAVDVATGRETAETFAFPEPVTEASRSTYGPTLGAGDVIMVRTQAGSLRIWTFGEKSVARDVPLAEPPSNRIGASNFAIASEARRLACPLDVAGEEQSRFLGVWDSQTGQRVAKFDAGSSIQGGSQSIAVSGDGNRVIYRTTGDGGVAHVGNVRTGKEVFALQLTGKADIRTYRYSSDGKRILTGDTWGGIQVWDATNGTLLRSIQHHRTTVIKFEFSPDRRFYASVADDGSTQVWDAVTDQPIGELLEQLGSSSRAEFSPDSTRIATPSAGGTARVWDVRTGLPVTERFTSEDSALVTAFTPDGRFLDVHGGAKVTQHLRVWAVPPPGTTRMPDWLLTLATICAGHRLTDEGKIINGIDELAKIAEVQRALAAAPANDPYAEWGRWILSASPTRPIAPGFTITPAEAAKVKAEWLKK